MALGKAAYINIAELSQVHQYFVWCSVEPRIGVEAINDMWSLKEKCREAFVCDIQQPSAAQQQVSENCAKWGCRWRTRFAAPSRGIPSTCSCKRGAWLLLLQEQIKVIIISSEGTWAVEFDGPSHFLMSRAPTGATLLKRR